MNSGIAKPWQQLAEGDPAYTTYQLIINLAEPQILNIGRLGRFEFPAGRYIYTGSARKNLLARVQRHLSKNKKLHWHIDYLLSSPAAAVIDVVLFKTPECDINRHAVGTIPVVGFGASDCRADCGSHLKYLGLISR